MLETDTLMSDGINLNDCDKCIVGEAWGFEADYVLRCVDCTTFGRKIWEAGGEYIPVPYAVELRSEYNKDVLHRRIKQFVNHWNKKHSTSEDVGAKH